MNTRRCLKIAARIDALLVQELGEGIEPARMLAEPAYARDVLLVCSSLPDTELPALAQQFRQALAAMPPEEAARAGQPSGFSASRFLNSLFGPSTGSPPSTLEGPASKPPRSWFGRLRDSIK